MTRNSHDHDRNVRIYRGLLVLLAAAAFLCLLIGIRNYPDVFDEGYSLYGAERILSGEVPYRDFWLVYAPAQFYILAGIFKVFGSSIMVARVYDVLVRLAIVVLVYAVASNLSSRKAALVSGLVGTLWLSTCGYYTYAIYPALALSLLAVWILLRHLEAPRTRWSLLCGLAVGAAMLFRHDIGLYDALTMVAVLAASTWLEGGGSAGAGGVGRVHALWKALWPFACGVSALVLPVLLALASAVPAGKLWFDLVLFPTTILNQYRGLTIPALPAWGMTRNELSLPILFYSPIVLFGCSVVHLVFRRRRWGVLALTLLGILYLRQALNRADEIHLLPATLVVAVLGPVLVFGAANSLRRWMSLLLIAAVVSVSGDVYVAHRAEYLARWLAYPITPELRYSLERGRGVEAIADQDAAVRYVQDHTLEGERIFVGDSRHDLLFINDILFYFLAARPCGTSYHDLAPGVATTLAVQQEIVSDLQRNRVRTIVLCSRWDDVIPEPNESGKSSGVTFLDSYLRSQFKPVARVGSYIIFQSEP